jgi:hypothetical protein
MSNVTPPGPAGLERLTVKVKVVVPALSSAFETSLTESVIPVGQKLRGEIVLRGAGAPAAKSAALLSVSVQPLLARKSAAVAEMVGAAPEPSKKFAPLVPVP